MVVPVAPVQPPLPGMLHTAHIIVTAILFLLNLLLTGFIAEKGFVARFSNVGSEMLFLALGLTGARLFLLTDAPTNVAFAHYLAWALTFFAYIVVWISVLFLTREVVDKPPRKVVPEPVKELVVAKPAKMHPQAVLALAIGFLGVYVAAVGFLESFFRTLLGDHH